ncbi:calcium-binding protein E63-1 isoform X2 [Chrysoperla carnea]|uniref:calcium-binding protein E63-1 isoform X2 n=1 Tax=Chrysoperla carnea TaxID=189513 RepID=UPI001D067CEE|nr:calcium-binding protein E63-1 isoform X2 [Chrysoperla carnea]
MDCFDSRRPSCNTWKFGYIPRRRCLRYLKTAFGLLDRNCDGRVTASELQFMLQNLGIHIRDEVIDELIKEASNSGNGRIDETEFLQWISRIQALSHEADDEGDSDDGTKDLIAAFRVFDRDRNGYITMDELRSAMDMIGEPVTDAQLSDLLSIADVDKDGKINYEEFVRLLL